MQKTLLILVLTVLFFLTKEVKAQTTSEKGKYDYAVMTYNEVGKEGNKIMVLYNNDQRIDYGNLKGIQVKPMSTFMSDYQAYLKVIQAMDDDGYELVTSSITKQTMNDKYYYVMCFQKT